MVKLPSVANMIGLSGKRVLVRVDFNVPIREGQVSSDYRLRAALPTIEYLKKAGAKIILASHLDGKGGRDMMPVSLRLKKLLPHDYIPETNMVVINEHIEGMKKGDVMLLSNLRNWIGEEMADEQFTRDFCKLFEFYVNEAFAVSHRNHASIVLFPKCLPSCVGMRFLKEIEILSRAFRPPQPFLFILSGAKFATKQPLVSKFMDIASEVFVGGALANDFFSQLGYETGRSLVAKPPVAIPEQIFGNPKLLLPQDVMVQTGDGTVVTKKPSELDKNDRVVDVGPETIRLLKQKIERAKFILWNGPLGIYEEGFATSSEELAITIAESQGFSLVGGGDTIAAIGRLQMEDTFDFVSTGGGAMLDFLVKETLPAIDAFGIKEDPPLIDGL